MAVSRLSLSSSLAAELLLMVGIRHHLWPYAPDAAQPIVSNALGACLVLWLLSLTALGLLILSELMPEQAPVKRAAGWESRA